MAFFTPLDALKLCPNASPHALLFCVPALVGHFLSGLQAQETFTSWMAPEHAADWEKALAVDAFECFQRLHSTFTSTLPVIS